jgi:putative addiction module component (TIGR02574 family)
MSTDSPNHRTAAEKPKLVEELQDNVAATSDVSMPNWQKEELARRKANLLNKPSSAITWEEVIAKVRGRSGR